MKKIQRTDSSYDKSWNVIKFIYYFMALPMLLCYGVISLFILKGEANGRDLGLLGNDFHLFTLMVWSAIILPLAFRTYAKKVRRRKLQKIVELLTSNERFSPQKQHQVLDAGRGKYLGIDTQYGNILYIHMVKKGLVDVIGLTMSDWTDSELEGSTLRVKTKNPEVPELSINAHPIVARELLNTLGAMSHKSYSESFPQEPWSLHVGIQSRFVEFEHNVVVPQAANLA